MKTKIQLPLWICMICFNNVSFIEINGLVIQSAIANNTACNISTVPSSGTYANGTELYGFISESSNPLDVWSNISVIFLGDNGILTKIYRYKIDCFNTINVTKLVIIGAGFNNGEIYIKDINNNTLWNHSLTYSNLYIEQRFTDIINVTGTTFFLDEYDTSSTWRYRKFIQVTYTVPSMNPTNYPTTNPTPSIYSTILTSNFSNSSITIDIYNTTDLDNLSTSSNTSTNDQSLTTTRSSNVNYYNDTDQSSSSDVINIMTTYAYTTQWIMNSGDTSGNIDNTLSETAIVTIVLAVSCAVVILGVYGIISIRKHYHNKLIVAKQSAIEIERMKMENTNKNKTENGKYNINKNNSNYINNSLVAPGNYNHITQASSSSNVYDVGKLEYVGYGAGDKTNGDHDHDLENEGVVQGNSNRNVIEKNGDIDGLDNAQSREASLLFGDENDANYVSEGVDNNGLGVTMSTSNSDKITKANNSK